MVELSLSDKNTYKMNGKTVEETFGTPYDDDDSEIPGAYLPAEDFVLAEFFDRYVKMAFIVYSAIKETAPRKEEDKRPPVHHR